jgi:putative ABC transport system ATP-binding protein
MLLREDDTRTHHEVVIDVKNVTKDFLVGKNVIPALRGVNLQIKATDFVVIFGPSGCGKSTLMNVILGLDRPSGGEVIIRDTDVYNLSDDKRATFRAQKIGMVHQMQYWIKSLNVWQNVAFPLIIEGFPERDALTRARRVMNEIGIADLAHQIPTQLSGGQQQKVGLARALVSNPWILMADEPTGNLDSTAGDEILAIFQELNVEHKRTVIIVTHNSAYWDCGNRRIEMKDGMIVKDSVKGE